MITAATLIARTDLSSGIMRKVLLGNQAPLPVEPCRLSFPKLDEQVFYLCSYGPLIRDSWTRRGMGDSVWYIQSENIMMC